MPTSKPFGTWPRARGDRDDIRRDTARLQVVTEKLRTLTNQTGNAARRPWLNQVTQGGVIAVAVLFQLAVILSVWALSVGTRKGEIPFRAEPAPNSETEINSETVSAKPEMFRSGAKQPNTDYYRQLWNQIEAHARSNSARLARGNGKISQASLCRDIGVSPPDLSGIKLLAQGQQVPRNPSRDSVEKLSKRFGVEMPKCFEAK